MLICPLYIINTMLYWLNSNQEYEIFSQMKKMYWISQPLCHSCNQPSEQWWQGLCLKCHEWPRLVENVKMSPCEVFSQTTAHTAYWIHIKITHSCNAVKSYKCIETSRSSGQRALEAVGEKPAVPKLRGHVQCGRQVSVKTAVQMCVWDFRMSFICR